MDSASISETQLSVRHNEAIRLCQTCTDSHLYDFLANNNDEDKYHLPKRSTWDVQNCDICQFLSQCLPAGCNADSLDEGQLTLDYSQDDIFMEAGVISRALDSCILVRNTFRLVKTQQSIPNRQQQRVIVLDSPSQWVGIEPTPPKIDFTMVSSWLESTFDQQEPWKRAVYTCFEEKRSQQESWNTAYSSALDLKLTVIDCIAGCLVRLPANQRYVTLSYVWGQKPHQMNDETGTESDDLLDLQKMADGDWSKPLPAELPLTIKDSISVCKSLQYRFLWVDRYCILQTDRRSKARQIQQMNDIYRGSSLTLIGCAGVGPDYGLPGVSKARAPCPSLQIGNTKYFQAIPSVEDIDFSIWATRCWTYQEAVLAQRRLYFTDRQLYYESSYQVESEFTTRAPVTVYASHSLHKIFSQVLMRQAPSNIYTVIRQYTARNLSFPSDAINALHGILSWYEDEGGVRNLWGIPFSTEAYPSVETQPLERPISFEEGLCWYNMWPTSPREGFPTWSWAGWNGKVFWNYVKLLNESSPQSDQASFSVKVELKSGRLITWAEYQEHYVELNDASKIIEGYGYTHQLSRYIHLEVRASRLMELSDPIAEGHTWLSVGLESHEGGPISLRYFMDPRMGRIDMAKIIRTVFWPLESFLVIHLRGPFRTGYERTGGAALLLQRRGDHWERFALLKDPANQLENARSEMMSIRLG